MLSSNQHASDHIRDLVKKARKLRDPEARKLFNKQLVYLESLRRYLHKTLDEIEGEIGLLGSHQPNQPSALKRVIAEARARALSIEQDEDDPDNPENILTQF